MPFDALHPSRFAIAILIGVASPALAWVYPEHRELSLLGVQKLDAERRAEFDRLWQGARAGDEQRLCAAAADREQGLAPPCIDWAALAAIAGDHSCSSRQMFETARASNWILTVADVAAQLKVDLARLPVTAEPASSGELEVLSDARRRLAGEAVRAERINALRTADIRLQRADPEYATRAGANNAHFLLARPSTDVGPADYAQLTLRLGSEVSAVGVYAWFHLSAMQKASRLRHESLSTAERNALARAMLADEAFALHFLQDVFAAGHVAGSWGDASQRQGTHDYYNQHGLEVFRWSGGRSVVLMGDAHMRAEDAEVAATAVSTSLRQVLDVVGRARRRRQLCGHARCARGAGRVRRVSQRDAAAPRRGHARAARGCAAPRADAGAVAGAESRPGTRRDAALPQRGRPVRRAGRHHRCTRRQRRIRRHAGCQRLARRP